MESNRTTGREEQNTSRGPGSLGYSPAASATQRATQPGQTASDLLDKGANAAGQAYTQVTDAVNDTVQQAVTYGKQAVDYGRDNPGKTALIALAAGIGIGIAVGSSFNSRNRSSRIVAPIVEALTVVALELFR